ncbi:carbonic anhydrase [Lyophyllum atratum]|nr:carbonic anhydrase [Lyophyllum atratum]
MAIRAPLYAHQLLRQQSWGRDDFQRQTWCVLFGAQLVKHEGNSRTVLAYAVPELRVKHVIVMGHCGCGGIAAATMNLPKPPLKSAAAAIYGWIDPIRALYATSTRPEVVAMRKKNKSFTTVKEPKIRGPGFRALIEENVKMSVNRVATSRIITEHYALLLASQKPDGNSTVEKRSDHPTKPAAEVFIYGWVYDIENGEVVDLGISVGLPGVEVPAAPFYAIARAAKGSL